MASTMTDRLNGLSTSVAVKAPVKAVATSNITLSGHQTIGGVAVVSGDRVLVTAQTNPVDNGIYDAAVGVWARSADFDGNRDVVKGTLIVRPMNGAAVLYQVTSADPITVGTTALEFAEPSLDVPVGWVTRHGATGDGVTNDAAALNIAYALGGTVYHPPGTYYIGTTPLEIPADTKLTFAKGAKFTVDSSTPASMPQAYLKITGSNVEIDGAVGYIASNPFSVYAQKGAFIGFGANNLSNIKIRNCDSTWFMHGIFGSHDATDTANSVSNVLIENCRFTSFATDIYHTGKSPVRWAVRGTVHDGARPAPSNNAGAIGIYPGVNIGSVDLFSQTTYDTDYGDIISITDCQVGAMKDRPIRLINCRKVNVSNNDLRLDVGSYFTGGAGTTYSADAITFDLCRQVVCSGNSIYGGGENGIDFLSCHDFRCFGNTIKQCDTSGVYLYVSDLYSSSGTTPKIDLVTNRDVFNVFNGEVFDNYIEAFYDIYVGTGRNLKIHDNQLALHKTSSYWSTGTPLLTVLNNTAGATFFAESPNHWMSDIVLERNHPVLGAAVGVTCNSTTDTFTSDVAHNLVTGDKVETFPGGAAQTVDYPTGLVYHTEYYVIRTGVMTFKLATSLANALAGTALDITTDGLTVGSSKLFVKEVARPCTVDVSSSYYDSTSNIVLDENIPGHVAVNLFSTFPAIVPGTAFLFRNVKHEFIYDPAIDYDINRNTLAKYEPIPELSTFGADSFGISRYSMSSGGYTFSLGTKPINGVGAPTDGYIRTTFW
jgi:uncharacterized cupin superfamily protein